MNDDTNTTNSKAAGKLTQFLDDAFRPYGDFPARKDVQQELLVNLTEKYSDLKAEGKSDDEAYALTVESFGDVSEIMEHVPHSHEAADSSNATGTGKAPGKSLGETIADGIRSLVSDPSRFRATALQDADLTGTQLAGNDFSASALMGANFENADLHQATFKATALKGANFSNANLSGARFDASDLQDTNLSNANLANAKLYRCAFRGAHFSNTTLDGAEFKQSDLSDVSFNGQTLRGTTFANSSLKNTTFDHAVLEDVSFHHSQVKHTNFNGATMDKVTYALLKGVKANLDNVTVK